MKKILLLLSFLTSFIAAQAQSLPLLEEGKTWHVGAWTMQYDDHPAFYVDYQVGGDTIVLGRAAKVVDCVQYDFNNLTGSTGHEVLREEDGKVWFKKPGVEEWNLAYDFSLNAGDSVEVWPIDCFDEGPYRLIVASVRNRVIGGMARKVLTLRQEHASATLYDLEWIEGIGSTKGIACNCGGDVPGPTYELQTCTHGDVCLYDAERDKPVDVVQTLPLLEEGKTWRVEAWTVAYFDHPSWYEYWSLMGDTIVGGMPATKIGMTGNPQFSPRLYSVIREEGDKVWFAPKGTENWLLAYDFSLDVGESVEVFQLGRGDSHESRVCVTVTDVRFCEVEGVLRKVLFLNGTWYDAYWNIPETLNFVWVQGIGSLRGVAYNVEDALVGGPAYVLDWCKKEDVCLYDQTKDNPTHITSPVATREGTTRLYDLQGRQLSAKPARGMYIRNGKKFLR